MNKKTKKFFVLKNTKQQDADKKIKLSAESVIYRDVLYEAEKIVDKYMENLGYTCSRQKTKNPCLSLVNTIIWSAVICGAYMLIKLF